nr:MAG TPA: head closure knob [Caudoviricetes sp.]
MDIYEYATKEFEKHYDSKMTVQVFGTSNDDNDDDDPFSDGGWHDYLVDVPCRIAQKRQISTAKEDVYAVAEISPYLYCNPKHSIPPGSKIFVTDRHGVTNEYERSGESFASYATHQEFMINKKVKA